MMARRGDVVQLNPEVGPGKIWGGLLCVVDEAKESGKFMRVYALLPQYAREPPEVMYIRVARAHCSVIGRSVFCDWVER